MRGLRGRIAIAGAVLLAAALALLVGRSRSEPSARNSGRSPARLTAALQQDSALRIRDRRRSALRVLDRPREPARPDGQPALRSAPRSTASSHLRARAGCTSHTDSRSRRAGRCSPTTCFAGAGLWHRTYSFGIDSMAISPNGRWIYMPAGERTTDGKWRIIAAADGNPSGRSIAGPIGAHNTIMGPGGRYLYLGGVDFPVSRGGEHRHEPRGAQDRPAQWPGRQAVHDQWFADPCLHDRKKLPRFPGHSICTGKVLYTVPVPGFSFDPANFCARPTTASRSRRTNAGSI